MAKGKAEESKLQSECVVWLWNNHPETRGLFFQVENEGNRLSSKVILELVGQILKNLNSTQNIIFICNKITQHCKNGNFIAGAQGKAMGIVSGVSDCIFVWNDVHFFEFKTEIGRQSDNQIEFEKNVKNKGHNYYVVRSLNQFVIIINAILAK